MRAAVVIAPGRLELADVARPVPGPGQVRVRLEGCGVCASNLPVWEGKPWFSYPLAPGAPGHEGWGHVDAVGSAARAAASMAGTALREGDRVAFLSGNAYAEYDVADLAGIVRVPPSLAGRPVPGEPLGCAVNVFGRSGVRTGQSVAIVGSGFLGLLLVSLASRAGARVLAISRRPYALHLARRYGAREALAVDDDGLAQRALDWSGGAGCDVVIEAAGRQSTLDLAASLTRVRGRLVIAGYHQDGPRQVDMQLWNWRGLDVINAHERDPAVYREGMALALAEMATGRLDPAPLCRTYPLEDLASALDATRERPDGFVKALVIP